MAKSESDYAAQILSTISTGLVTMAAQASARADVAIDEAAVLREANTALQARVAQLELSAREPVAG